MKKLILPFVALFIAFTMSGCGLVEDAFKAGLIFAVVIIAIIGLIVWLARIVTSAIGKKYKLQLVKV